MYEAPTINLTSFIHDEILLFYSSKRQAMAGVTIDGNLQKKRESSNNGFSAGKKRQRISEEYKTNT